MKIRCPKINLLKALDTVAPALPATTTIPELTHVCLNATEQALTISATNMRTFISTQIECETEIPGEVLIQGKFFHELVHSMSSASNSIVQIEVEPMSNRVQLTIAGDRSCRNDIPGRQKDDYPEVELIHADFEFEMDGKEFRELLRIGSICSSQTENSLQGFRGVCLDFQNGGIQAASTDGNRLMKASKAVNIEVEQPLRWMISQDVCSELSKIMPSDEVHIRQKGNKFLVEFDSTIFQSLLSQADFLDYEEYIPEDLSGGVELDRNLFLEHLKGVNPVARENGNRVVFELKENAMGVRAFSEILGEAYREMGIENRSSDMTVAFNSKYIMDYLGSIPDQQILMLCEGEGMPAYFWGENNSENSSHICVIMSLSLH